ncbi:hypothetical protein C8F04DRAFT_1069519 [Mycena alexandri]|uniref:F-box domain-containing protein n=1 Tax=Mycena alexandri TaxID=1745969 RepID=A0AAD6TDY0_9AGAR|nr:hypothetical protein C8F04DRAFT_1069519 [Mycena alexandri]
MSRAALLRERIADLADSISRQKLLLDDLQAQLDAVVYPVLTLPPEITSEIFIQCLPVDRSIDAVNTAEAPLLLTHICGVWRQIAISTPELWATFEVDVFYRHLCLAEIANTWLGRTGECPLTVKISRAIRNMDLDVLWQVLFQYSSRIRSLGLEVDGEILRPIPGSSKTGYLMDFPTLERFSIAFFPFEAEDTDLVAILNNVPLLHEVTITELSSSLVTLPTQQITKFTGKFYAVAQCLEALTLMPQLTECAFAVLHKDLLDRDPEPFTHSHLRHLTLFGTTQLDPTNRDAWARSMCVLASLRLPALQTLEITGVNDFDRAALNSFLVRSSPPLRKLLIHPLAPDGGTTLRVSPSFTALDLTDLAVSYPSRLFIGDFFSFFTANTFLPQLRSLSLLGCRVAWEELDIVQILDRTAGPVTDRRNLEGCVQLQTFRAVADPKYSRLDYPESAFLQHTLLRFKALKASGMDIHVGTEWKSVV